MHYSTNSVIADAEIERVFCAQTIIVHFVRKPNSKTTKQHINLFSVYDTYYESNKQPPSRIKIRLISVCYLK